MFNNLLRAGAVALALLIPTAGATAGGVDGFVENNWVLETENFTGEVRTFINLNYTHIDLEYRTPIKGVSVGYRFAEANKLDEHRFDVKYTYDVTSWFYVAPSIEYRVFNSIGPDNRFRIRPQVGVTTPTWKRFTGYAEFTPMWEFGDGVDGVKFTLTKTVVGVDYDITDHITFGPFFEYDTLENWHTDVMYFGTVLKAKL
jgi:hypothetical protein